VILASPFDAFNEYERANGLPVDFIRGVNSRDPDTNAWARFERREVTASEFDALFGDESESHGHRVAGADVITMLSGAVRPEMVRARGGTGARPRCLRFPTAGVGWSLSSGSAVARRRGRR
jgi:putative hydrolase of the HAD superfamily